MKKRFVIGNWKMNPVTVDGAMELAKDIDGLVDKLDLDKNKIVTIICPAFIGLEEIAKLSLHSIGIGAQDAWPGKSGAFTGEVSMEMLKSLGIQNVILGHSERRRYQNETSKIVNQKTQSALAHNITPIICVGEEQKGQGESVAAQLTESLQDLNKEEINKIIVAYEPVWAIGTGDNADANYVATVITSLRKAISDLGGNGEQIPMLYGGSVNAQNASEYANDPQINGALVGGASLDVEEFNRIVKAFA